MLLSQKNLPQENFLLLLFFFILIGLLPMPPKIFKPKLLKQFFYEVTTTINNWQPWHTSLKYFFIYTKISTYWKYLLWKKILQGKGLIGPIIGPTNTFCWYKKAESRNSFLTLFLMFSGFLWIYIEFIDLFRLIHKT